MLNPKRFLQLGKVGIYHFHNGAGGGILSVIRNLLRYAENSRIENHIIYTINKTITPLFSVPKIEGAASEQVFYYSPKWNFYYTCRQLAKLLPDDESIVVAHDWLELGMISNLGLQNPVIQFVHGDYDYYYQLAKVNANSVDRFVAVAQNIEFNLEQMMPNRKDDIYYRRFPVPEIRISKIESDGNTNIIFVGRLEKAKGYPLVPVIAKRMKANKKIQWHVVGSEEKDSGNIIWDENIPLTYYGDIANNEVIELLGNMQLLILPSLGEGMPVTVIEAMKAGVIPLVNDIDGGIRELVINEETGYRIRQNDISGYIEKINLLMADKSKSMRIRNNCIKSANLLFDPLKNTRAIEDVFFALASGKRRRKSPRKIYGSRLDAKWIPNWMTNTIRSLYK